MKAKKLFNLLGFLILLAAFAPQATMPAAASSRAAYSSVAAAPSVCSTDPSGCAVFQPSEEIKIGYAAPITGDNAVFGIDISQGELIAISDGGNVQGWSFALSIQDDGGTPDGGVTAANNLVADPKVVAVAGHIFSGATEAAIPIYESVGIPMMSPSASNPTLTQTGSKVFNRVVYTDTAQGQFSAQYLFFNLGLRRLAVLHDEQMYGQWLAGAVASQFKILGGQVVDVRGITAGGTDYCATLTEIGNLQPQALYYGGYAQEASVIANQMDQCGLSNVIFFGGDGVYGQDFINQTGQNGEGAFAVSMVPPDSPELVQFNAAYLARFGVEAGSLTPYTWNGYDAAALLISVIKKVAIKGDDNNLYIPRGALVSAVRNVRGYQGLTGTLTCYPTGDCNQSGPSFYQVQSGEWVPAGFASPAFFTFLSHLAR